MKIFGIEIGGKKKEPEQLEMDFVQDQVPEVRTVIPKMKKPTMIPRIPDPALRYHGTRARGRGHFQPSEYNLSEVGRVEDTDGYVRQSFDKKTALMFKEDWDIVGPDPKTIKYIKTRFAQIARASGIPTKQLFRNIGASLVRKSNAFVVKVRKKAASGGRMRREPGSPTPLQPVAGYFVLPAETMEFQLSGNKIVKWKQKMPNGDYKQWNPRDVIHFHYDRKDGFVFGTPTIVPVIDDIRALRKIEENIELLVYQHLFPLFQYKVGTENAPAGITESGEDEIDVVKREIMFMPTEGGIVTPERHEIKAIGAEGRAIRAEGYLDHFKKRVFSGLGVSAVDMGEGECYDIHTQTLTENGWKYHWEINHDLERIATYNPETDKVEYHIANYKYEGHYEGDMIAFKGKHIDIKVTPHHEMWVLNRYTGKTQKVYAIDLYNSDMSEFCFIDSVSGFDGNSADIQIGNDLVDSRLWMEFLGWWISEGSVDRYNGKKGRYRTVITQKKARDIDSIRTCLSRLPFNFKEQIDKRDGTVNFIIYSKALYEKLEPLGTSTKKFIPSDILEYDTEHSQILLDSLMKGDGTWDLRDGRNSGIYYTSSKKLANDVQVIALHAGYSAKVSFRKNSGYSDGTIYRVLITKSDKRYRILTPDHISKEHYSNTIYCYNVENHLFITRRNGILAIQGNTANRATADNMSRNLIDAVKDFQQVMEIFVNEYIINELLLESTFGASVLDEERRCWMKFKEIDIDAQIKKEAHNADQFNKNVITWDEARTKSGYEPITVPTRQEMDSETDTAQKYPEWHKTFWKIFEEPKLLIQSLDEPFSSIAKAVARNQSLEPTSADMDEAAKNKNQQEIDLEKERTKAKVAVAKAKPAPPKTATRPSAAKRKDSFLVDTYNVVMKDVVEKVRAGETDHDWIAAQVRTEMGPTVSRLIADMVVSYQRGYSIHKAIDNDQFIRDIALSRRMFQERAERYVHRLVEDTIRTLQRKAPVPQNIPTEDLVRTVRSVFDSLRYRTRFIEDVEIRKARGWGEVRARHNDDDINNIYTVPTGEDTCDSCKAHAQQVIHKGLVTLEDIPPFHAACNCKLMFVDAVTETVQDGAIDDPSDYDVPKEDYHACPNCGKTAIRKKDTPDIYNCRACKTSFRVEQPKVSKVPEDQDEMPGPIQQMDENTEDKLGPKSRQTQFSKCVLKAKARLRSQHPDWDEGKIEMLAEVACDHHLQRTNDIENEESEDVAIEDVAKLERCVLKVKKQLRKEHPDWDEDKIKSSAFAICNAQLKGK